MPKRCWRRNQKTKSGNVTIEWHHGLDEVLGDAGGVTGIRIRHQSGSTKEVPVHGVFIAIGHTPNTTLFEGQLDMDNGYIPTKCSLEGNQTATNIEGVFAAGDVQDYYYRQAITSAGGGWSASGCRKISGIARMSGRLDMPGELGGLEKLLMDVQKVIRDNELFLKNISETMPWKRVATRSRPMV